MTHIPLLHLPSPRACFAPVLLAAVLGLGAAQAVEVPAPMDKIENVDIVVGGLPYNGTIILPATSTEFSFKIKDTGDVMQFRWSSLDAAEAKRLQKLVGIQVSETGVLEWGDEVDCVRFRLASKKTVEGMEVFERALPGYRCLQTATQTFQIPKNEIEEEFKIKKLESQVISAEEKYKQILSEQQPGTDTNAHLKLVRTCMSMGLFDKAIDHLSIAESLDPRTAERNKPLKDDLLVKDSEKRAEKLYLLIIGDMNREDFQTAQNRINSLRKNFPNSSYRARIDELESRVATSATKEFRQQVIFMYYNQFAELIKDKLATKIRVDAKGRPVPIVPGKQVTTKGGLIIKGTLVMDAPDKITIKKGDDTWEINRKDVLAVTDCDLSVAVGTKEMTFTQLKAYVTDKDNGLGKDLIAKISDTLKKPEDEVKKAWETRNDRKIVLSDGDVQREARLAQDRTAFYGKGSWLREGAQFMPSPDDPNANGGANGGKNNGNSNGGGGGGGGIIQAKAAAKAEDPESSDDPDKWWTVQTMETKLMTLKGLAAEKIMKVTDVKGDTCIQCAGKGIIEAWDTYGSKIQYRCPTCRGMHLLTKIYYK